MAFSSAARRYPVWDRALIIALVEPAALTIRFVAGDVPFMNVDAAAAGQRGSPPPWQDSVLSRDDVTFLRRATSTTVEDE